MVKVLAVVAMMAVAQLIPACGDQDEGASRVVVVGYVGEKRRDYDSATPWLLVINNHEYGAPYEFWLNVEIGDLVRYDGRTWRIVRRARG